MAGFANQMKAWERKTERKMDLAVRKIALEMFRRIILKSPVDTGRFRGNWQLAIGSVPEGTLELDDKTGTATIAKGAATALGFNAGETIFFTNNLPYARRLEEGYSQQAPNGMVALTIQEFQSVVSRIGIELSIQ
jgi:hypothetical protein